MRELGVVKAEVKAANYFTENKTKAQAFLDNKPRKR